MVYNFNVKGQEDDEKLGRKECILRRSPRSPEMSDYIKPYQ